MLCMHSLQVHFWNESGKYTNLCLYNKWDYFDKFTISMTELVVFLHSLLTFYKYIFDSQDDT